MKPPPHSRRAVATAAALAAAVALAAPAAPAVATPVLYIASLCGPTSCRALTGPCEGSEDPACGCVASVQGELCAECSFAGFLLATPNGDVCRCYDAATADPNNVAGPCTSVVNATGTFDAVVTYSRGWCDAWADREKGSWAQPPPFAYGREPAPQITACTNPAFGPPPDAVREAPETLPPMTCNSYGAPDPALAGFDNDTWALCGGHGDWDRAHYRCVCQPGWALADPGPAYVGVGGERPLVCTQCAELFGPRPGEPGLAPGSPLCVAPYAPDPVTGIEDVCSGHGSPTSDAECACYNATGTTGSWTLTPLSQAAVALQYVGAYGTQFVAQTYTATVMTCGTCAAGAGPPGNCTALL